MLRLAVLHLVTACYGCTTGTRRPAWPQATTSAHAPPPAPPAPAVRSHLQLQLAVRRLVHGRRGAAGQRSVLDHYLGPPEGRHAGSGCGARLAVRRVWQVSQRTFHTSSLGVYWISHGLSVQCIRIRRWDTPTLRRSALSVRFQRWRRRGH